MNLFNPSRVTVAAAVSALLAGGVAQAADDAAQSTNNGADGGDQVLQEITVTATRRAEEINKVPLNITAYTPELMDDQGVRQIDDLARLTPDLQFTHTSGAAGNNSSNIAIRGVFSDVGAATTGIYIDDTPIQMRNVGYWNANAFPQIFDLERVEVLARPAGHAVRRRSRRRRGPVHYSGARSRKIQRLRSQRACGDPGRRSELRDRRRHRRTDHR